MWTPPQEVIEATSQMRRHARMGNLPEMLSFWAKSGHDGDAAPMHSVPHHCLDVAACAYVLAPILPPPSRLPWNTIAALVALHDIGKFTRTFQAKVEALWPAALLGQRERRSPRSRG